MGKDKAILFGAAVGIIGIIGIFALRRLHNKSDSDDGEQIYQGKRIGRDPEDCHGIEYYSVR